MILKTDCRYYAGDRPCRFNKSEGIKCDNCTYYKTQGFRIVIVKFDALGDVLRTTCLLPSLKKLYPDSHITWITLQGAAPLFYNNPFVDQVLYFEQPFTHYLTAIAKYDLLIHPDASPVSAALASSIHAGEKRGFGLDHNGKVIPFNTEAITWLEMGVFDAFKKANTLTYQHHIHALSKLEYTRSEILLFLTEDEKSFAHSFYKHHNLARYKTLIALNTGASARWQLKQWYPDSFDKLIRKLKQNSDIGVLLYGGADEQEKNHALKNKYPNVIDTGCNNTLRQFFALLNLSDIVLTGDTMALHAATALKKKVICYFGPTSANEIEDYGLISKIQPDMDCLVCYKQQCDFNPNCMQSIEVDLVYDAIIKLLN